MPRRFRIFPESLFFAIFTYIGGVMSTYVFCITVLLIAAKIISECVQ